MPRSRGESRPSDLDGAPVMTAPTAARAFHVMSKPTGAICNLDCEYCFFLSKDELYPGSGFRMPPHSGTVFAGLCRKSILSIPY